MVIKKEIIKIKVCMFKLILTIIVSALVIILGLVLMTKTMSQYNEIQEDLNMSNFLNQGRLITESYEISIIENYDINLSLRENSFDYPKALSKGGYIGKIPKYNGNIWSSGAMYQVDYLKLKINTPKNCILIEKERDVRVNSIPHKPSSKKELFNYGCWSEYDLIAEEKIYIAYFKLP